jgi:hypothetical protein
MPIVPILCAVLLLGGIAALAMSGKTWRWYHITITAFVMLLSLVMFYLAARVLKVQVAWRTEIRAYEKAIAQEQDNEKKILAGGDDAEGKPHIPLVQLKNDVAKYLQGRGRVWDHVVRAGAGAIGRDGTINATTEHPEGLEKNLVVWVYDEGPADGKNALLGQFEVSEINGNNVKLIPALKLRPAELARIAKPNNAPLVLYEIMPTDSPELNDEIAKAFPGTVPAAVKSEYEKDGKPPEANARPDRIWVRVKALKEFAVPLSSAEAKELQARKTTPPAETDVVANELKIAEGTVLLLDPVSAGKLMQSGDVEVAKSTEAEPAGDDPAAPAAKAPSEKVYVRELRDYAQLYRDLNLQIEDLLRSFTEVDNQNKTVVDATAKVAKDTAFREKEKVALIADRDHFVADLMVIRKHVTALSELLTKTKAQIKSMIAANRELSNQMAKLMRDAADRINRQTATAAAGTAQ